MQPGEPFFLDIHVKWMGPFGPYPWIATVNTVTGGMIWSARGATPGTALDHALIAAALVTSNAAEPAAKEA